MKVNGVEKPAWSGGPAAPVSKRSEQNVRPWLSGETQRLSTALGFASAPLEMTIYFSLEMTVYLRER